MRERGKGVSPTDSAILAPLAGSSLKRESKHLVTSASDPDVHGIQPKDRGFQRSSPKFRPIPTHLVLLIFVVGFAGCLGNPANVRTFASAVQTVTEDTPGIVAADQASCEENAALQKEYQRLEHQKLTPPPCTELSRVLQSLLAENTALEAYAKALNNMAQDQFVTTDADANAVTTTLRSAGVVSSPVVAAVGSIFALIETAALKEYRQSELSKAMTGEPASAFKIIMASYSQLATQYSDALNRQLSNIEFIRGAISHDHQTTEPVAVAEVSVRLDALHQNIEAKATAIKAFTGAIANVDTAFDSAAQDLNNPNPKDIYDSVSAFATQVKDAHDKLKKAFGGP